MEVEEREPMYTSEFVAIWREWLGEGRVVTIWKTPDGFVNFKATSKGTADEFQRQYQKEVK